MIWLEDSNGNLINLDKIETIQLVIVKHKGEVKGYIEASIYGVNEEGHYILAEHEDIKKLEEYMRGLKLSIAQLLSGKTGTHGGIIECPLP